MLRRPKCPVIALEEHYWDKELAAQFVGAEGVRDPEMLKRLYDLGELRLKEMDEAGIDMQVLSHGAPSAQKLSGPDAVALTRRVNDRLQAVVAANPKRFAAFAALPTSDPKAAADELERTVKLGFKGAMIHGLANGVFSTTSGFGRSSNARRRSTFRSTCIRRCRCRRSWMPIIRSTPATSRWWCGPPGATRWRPQPTRSA